MKLLNDIIDLIHQFVINLPRYFKVVIALNPLIRGERLKNTQLVLTVFLLINSLQLFASQKKDLEYPSEIDANILIFSTSHKSQNYLIEKHGILKIEISAFDKILQVDINGELISLLKDSKTEFEYPYILSETTTILTVTAVTKNGKAQKVFELYNKEKPKNKEDSFQVVGILGATRTDNVDNVADDSDKEKATKTTLTLVPSYNFYLDDNSLIKAKSIILREKFSDSQYASKEVSYSKFAARWILKKVIFSQVFAELGGNDIRMENKGLLGEEEIASEIYISSGFNHVINKDFSWKAELAYKLIDSKVEVDNKDDNLDGGSFSFTTSGKYKINGLNTSLKLGYGFYDAEGKYEDSSNYSAGLKVSYAIGDWTPSVDYSQKIKEKNIEDPRKGEKVKNTLSSYAIRLKYKLFKKLHLGLEYKNKDLTSNYEKSEYSTSLMTISTIFMF